MSKPPSSDLYFYPKGWLWIALIVLGFLWFIRWCVRAGLDYERIQHLAP